MTTRTYERLPAADRSGSWIGRRKETFGEDSAVGDGVQGAGWQTGVPAACAAISFARGWIQERGILAPECINPQRFLELMAQHEMPWHVIELPSAN